MQKQEDADINAETPPCPLGQDEFRNSTVLEDVNISVEREAGADTDTKSYDNSNRLEEAVRKIKKEMKKNSQSTYKINKDQQKSLARLEDKIDHINEDIKEVTKLKEIQERMNEDLREIKEIMKQLVDERKEENKVMDRVGGDYKGTQLG